jgi:hypothetical protein
MMVYEVTLSSVFCLTLIVWSVLIIQYSAALRSCKGRVTYARMSPSERKTMATVMAAMSEVKKGA